MTIHDALLSREASASVALDGETQSVPATVTPVAVPDRRRWQLEIDRLKHLLSLYDLCECGWEQS